MLEKAAMLSVWHRRHPFHHLLVGGFEMRRDRALTSASTTTIFAQ